MATGALVVTIDRTNEEVDIDASGVSDSVAVDRRKLIAYRNTPDSNVANQLAFSSLNSSVLLQNFTIESFTDGHFSFYNKQEENPNYNKEILNKGGWKILKSGKKCYQPPFSRGLNKNK